jgi:hypothetical protein
MNIDIDILIELKLMDEPYTHYSHGYEVIATTSMHAAQGGVVRAYRSSKFREVEAVKRYGPTVISFQLVTGRKIYSCVDGYIPPGDVETVESINKAFEELYISNRMFMVDLNVEQVRPRGETAKEITNVGIHHQAFSTEAQA